MNRGSSERGSALVISLMMMLALAFVGAGLVLTTGSNLRVAGDERRGTQAQFAAEAGIQEALHRLAMAAGTSVTVNSVTFDPAIRDTNVPPDPNWETRIYVPGATTPTSMDTSVTYAPTAQESSEDLEYAQSGNFLTIRHKWIDLDGDDVRDLGEVVRYDPSLMPPENFISGPPVEVVEVTGHRADSRRRLRVEATRYPFSANVLAAISSDRGIDVRGNVNICGHNHLISTPVDTDLETNPACSPNFDAASGHLPAITTTGDDVDRRGSSNLQGQPTATDTSSTNPFYSLAEALGVTQDVVDRILANPDHTSSSDGNPLDGVTFVDGDATGGQKFNNVNGTGLLYVNGDLDVSGSIVWRGLIYVEGDFKITGTPWILGGVIVRGRSDYAFSGGSPAILYSRDMIQAAVEPAFDYIVLSWKEF